MIDGKFREERKHNGKKIIIDLCKLPSGIYEVMAMHSNWIDFDVFHSWNFDEAVSAYETMLKKYPADSEEKPLTGKYAKLRDDLKIAIAAGKKVEEENPEDGGACNFDSCAIDLPRWREKLIKQAAKEAGTSCHRWRLFGNSSSWVFSPDTHSQGNARSRNAEEMTKTMKEYGYDAMDYCQMD